MRLGKDTKSTVSVPSPDSVVSKTPAVEFTVSLPRRLKAVLENIPALAKWLPLCYTKRAVVAKPT